MVDYDGYDHLVTYLNGLDWTGSSLTEPSYEEGTVDRIDTMKSNSIIITQDTLEIPTPSTDKYRYVWGLSLFFVHNVKADAFANLDFIVQNILNYNSNIVLRMWVTGGTVRYTRSKRNFVLNVTVQELKNR
jgi:hypothetical protein